MRHAKWLWVCALLFGCAEASPIIPVIIGDGTDGTSTEVTTGATDPSTLSDSETGTTPPSTDPTPTDSETDTAPAVCGNNAIEGTEACDDGNAGTGDGCTPECKVEGCGDGKVGANLGMIDGFETGNTSRLAWDASSTYTFRATSKQKHSGNWAIGVTNKGLDSSMAEISLRGNSDDEVCFWFMGESEAADLFSFLVDGAQRFTPASSSTLFWTEACVPVDAGTHTFTWRYTKNATKDTGLDAYFIDDVKISGPFTEECDDGNTVDGDVCSNGCLFNICGNGRIDANEDCDDSDTNSGDGCSTICLLERCGDGVVQTNARSAHEEGFEAANAPSDTWDQWGDYDFEVTIDQARSGTHSFSTTNSGIPDSIAETSITTYTTGNMCFWYAGSSEIDADIFRFLVDGTEKLSRSGDFETWQKFCVGASAGDYTFTWQYEKDSTDYYGEVGWDAFYIDDIFFSDAVAEECEDGNTINDDNCSNSCLNNICGNNRKDVGETCDDGDTDAGDGCGPTCLTEMCGNGYVDKITHPEHVETFETALSTAWTMGSTGFGLSTAHLHGGARALGPSNIGIANSAAVTTIKTYSDGQICFWMAGWCEPSSTDGWGGSTATDRFSFFIDKDVSSTSALATATWSDNNSTWTERCYTVTPGVHTFSWVYSKDDSTSAGWDAYYIDDIRFAHALTEECDDGNAINNDGCSNACQRP